jgi:transposase InsO family protein
MPWQAKDAMNLRTEFVLRALKTDNFRALCEEYRISTKTGYKWKERFLAEGLRGIKEQSRRPKSCPQGLSEGVVCDIIRLRLAHRYWGARKLRVIYGRSHAEVPSESSFKRVLERAGLVERRRIRSRKEAGRVHNGRKAQAPNEVWTVDFKGWWHDARGERCEPLSVRDEFSRYVLDLRAVADARTATIKAAFERLFQQNGLPGAIRSDNGPPFASDQGILGLSKLSAWWLVLGIDLERGRPGCPQDNGGHERLHWDISREVEGHSFPEQQAALDQWRQTFNQERPHESLGMKCPHDIYSASKRRYEGTPEDLQYDGMDQRRVHKTGYITYQSRRVPLSKALAGWSVGLKPSGDERLNVWFARLLLGEVDLRTAALTRATSAAPPAATGPEAP